MLQQVSYEKWSLEDFSYYRIWSCPERASGVSYSVYHVFIQNIFWNRFSSNWVLSLMAEPEAAIQRCSFEKVFLKYAVNLQENTHAEVRFQ